MEGRGLRTSVRVPPQLGNAESGMVVVDLSPGLTPAKIGENHLRHSRFVGLRAGKKAKDVVRE
jgi:hypothetical protein